MFTPVRPLRTHEGRGKHPKPDTMRAHFRRTARAGSFPSGQIRRKSCRRFPLSRSSVYVTRALRHGVVFLPSFSISPAKREGDHSREHPRVGDRAVSVSQEPPKRSSSEEETQTRRPFPLGAHRVPSEHFSRADASGSSVVKPPSPYPSR